MSTVSHIPLQPKPQTFEIVLGTTQCTLTVKWNTVSQIWVLDIADSSGNLIVGGIPLVTGADLLAQYAYLNLGGKLIAQTDASVGTPPTYENLGTDGNLYFVTTP